MKLAANFRATGIAAGVMMAALMGTSALASPVVATFLPGIEAENPSVAVKGPAPAAAPIELASFSGASANAARDAERALRGSIESNLPLTDISLRHTDKTFFSHNPVSFNRVPRMGDADNDAESSLTYAWADESPPFDQVVAIVDLSDQRMRIYVEGVKKYEWKVSSGKRGYGTPTGEWRPYRMHTLWRSRKYNNAPMPHSVFFHGGYAVHATGAVGNLGRPASHGCVRLHPTNAKQFFSLVSEYKKDGTIVRVVR